MMSTISFDYRRIAEGYAKDRPFLHGQVMERLTNKMQKHYQNGLDVGCGAGLSTKALRQVCDRVTGTDISEEMVRAASALYTEPEYSFVLAGAEEIVAPPDTYDIVTAAGVINWIDEKKFLSQMAGVMKEGGLLLVYDFWISGRMEGKPAFTEWYEKEYVKEFPKPPRKERVWTKEDTEAFHFELLCQETYSMECEMSMEQFVRFMLLQSNVIAQVEEKGKDIETVRQYFEESARPYFMPGMKEKLIFDGYSWYLRLKAREKSH
ncbi:MAG: class I SAM-dependent methyltransferase [Lachnospiraceae bacterium]|nr:class I SAM-dependent methyltransferase [Lachnospiraceae bacterium]